MRIIIYAILLAMLVCGLSLYFLGIDFLDYAQRTSLCLFRCLTGRPCPFCGMTRAFLALGQLQLMKAIHFNFLAIPLFILMVIYLFTKRMPLWLQHKGWSYLAIFTIIVSWLLRFI